MPDFTNESYYHCCTAEFWQTEVEGSNGNKYIVRWDNTSHKNRAWLHYDYSCSCKAYLYHLGSCKHIQKVIEDKTRCGWVQFTDGGEVVRSEGDAQVRCPKCRDIAISQRWGGLFRTNTS